MSAGPVKKTEKKLFAGKPGPGRPKGIPNKNTRLLKDMILQALDKAGGVEYLERQAAENPGPFLTLVGKVLPMQLTGADGEKLTVEIVRLSE